MSEMVSMVMCPVNGCDKSRAEVRLDSDGYFISPVGFVKRTGSSIALEAAMYERPLPEVGTAARRRLDVWLLWENETGHGRLDPDTGNPSAVRSCRHTRHDSNGHSTAMVIVDGDLIAKALHDGLRAIRARFDVLVPKSARD